MNWTLTSLWGIVVCFYALHVWEDPDLTFNPIVLEILVIFGVVSLLRTLAEKSKPNEAFNEAFVNFQKDFNDVKHRDNDGYFIRTETFKK